MISTNELRPMGDLFAAPREGIQRGVSHVNAAADKLAEGEITPENMIEVMQAETLVKANAAYLRSVQNVLGSLLNTRA